MAHYWGAEMRLRASPVKKNNEHLLICFPMLGVVLATLHIDHPTQSSQQPTELLSSTCCR